MQWVWEQPGPVSVRQAVEALRPRRDLTYNTVMTVMDRLHRKGLLDRTRRDRIWWYEPTLSRARYTSALMDEALGTAADRPAALAHFARTLPPEEAAALPRALDDAGDGPR